MRAASLALLTLTLLCEHPVSATDCAEHGACCFPRADPYPMPRDRFAPSATRPRAIAGLVVRGALSRPTVRRVLGGDETPSLAGCGDSLRFAVAPSGRVVDVNDVNICAPLRALRFPASDGVTEVVLTLATPTASAR